MNRVLSHNDSNFMRSHHVPVQHESVSHCFILCHAESFRCMPFSFNSKRMGGGCVDDVSGKSCELLSNLEYLLGKCVQKSRRSIGSEYQGSSSGKICRDRNWKDNLNG